MMLNPDDVRKIIKSYKETKSIMDNAVVALHRPKRKYK